MDFDFLTADDYMTTLVYVFGWMIAYSILLMTKLNEPITVTGELKTFFYSMCVGGSLSIIYRLSIG